MNGGGVSVMELDLPKYICSFGRPAVFPLGLVYGEFGGRQKTSTNTFSALLQRLLPELCLQCCRSVVDLQRSQHFEPGPTNAAFVGLRSYRSGSTLA